MKILNPIETPQSQSINNKQFVTKLEEHISESITKSRFILDRYEGDFAICENQSTGQMIKIPKSKISPLAQDGDVLKFKKNFFKIAFKETRIKKEKMKKLLESLK